MYQRESISILRAEAPRMLMNLLSRRVNSQSSRFDEHDVQALHSRIDERFVSASEASLAALFIGTYSGCISLIETPRKRKAHDEHHKDCHHSNAYVEPPAWMDGHLRRVGRTVRSAQPFRGNAEARAR